MIDIGYQDITKDGIIVPPAKASKQSACADVRACLHHDHVILYYDTSSARVIFSENEDSPLVGIEKRYIFLRPGDRVPVPTGMIIKVPHGYSARLHPRSGLALKCGLTLSNAEGVIDSDYPDELFVILTNTNLNANVTIKHGDRICQIEIVKNEEYRFIPTSKTEMNDHVAESDRAGGLGSTGVE